MNKKKKLYVGKYLLLAGLALLLTAGGIFWYLFQEKRDEAKIIRNLQTLAADLSKSSEENPAITLLKIKSCSDAFAFPSTISFGKNHSNEYDRERLTSSISRYRALFKELNISISDIQVTLKDSENADVIFSGQYTAESKLGSSHSDVNDVTAVMVKVDGSWKIKDLHLSKVLH